MYACAFPPPFREVVVSAKEVDLAYRCISGSQLRDSAGFAPASPFSLPFRGDGTLADKY